MDYANRKNIPFVVLVGKDEIASGKLTMKNMKTGEQQPATITEFINLSEKVKRNWSTSIISARCWVIGAEYD